MVLVKRRTTHFLLLLVLAALLLAGGALAWQHRDLASREQVMEWLERFREMGPLVFFSLMAVLPLFWAPLSPFLLLAPAFGTGTAIVGSIVAISVNMTLSWLVAGRWFRPFFERLVTRFGYSVPTLTAGEMVSVAILMRLTPGMPFPLQNYLLGLARMPLGAFLMVSLPIVCAVSVSVILFGEALMKGSLGLAMAALAAAIAVAIGVRFVRLRYRAKALSGGDEHGLD